MLEKLARIEERYDEINRLLMDVGSDYQKAAALGIERAELEPLVNKAHQYRQALSSLEEAQELLDSDDEELRLLAESEISELEPQIVVLEAEIRSMLLPRDKRDTRNVIMEIRAGTGGDEAALFGADLFRMYTRYAERQGWDTDIMSANEIGIGGYKEIIFLIKGKGAYSRMKYESGAHRVQRIPVTESQGRIHTSAATVAVMAEVDDVEIKIPENDIRMDVYKSAGAGGQSVQKNSTAVRLTHIPTGIVVQCQQEKSQHRNKEMAIKVLKSRLHQMETQKQEKKLQEIHDGKDDIGFGSQIRSYILHPYQMVKDHRLRMDIGNVNSVLDGGIDPFIEGILLQK